MRSIHIALLSAMPEEIGTTLEHLENTTCSEYGDLKVHTGEWKELRDNCVSVFISIAWSGWGKVSAARAITRLISNADNSMPINLVLFTGVAGAADLILNQWDVIVPDEVMQYDMDARPLFKQFLIPALNKDKLKASIDWTDWIYKSLTKAKNNSLLDEFGKINKGLIATGDTFISDRNILKRLSKSIPKLSAVEMEGAAVAQVCSQEGIPWTIVRVISDNANDSAAESFNTFIKKYKNYSWKLIRSILIEYKNAPVIK